MKNGPIALRNRFDKSVKKDVKSELRKSWDGSASECCGLKSKQVLSHVNNNNNSQIIPGIIEQRSEYYEFRE